MRHAVELAQQHGAELTGVTVVDARAKRRTPGADRRRGGGAGTSRVPLQITSEHVAEAVAGFRAACEGPTCPIASSPRRATPSS